jgi:hypothetical protein
MSGKNGELPVLHPVPGAVDEQDYADMAYHCVAHSTGYEDAITLMMMIGVERGDVMLARQQLKLALLTRLGEELGT